MRRGERGHLRRSRGAPGGEGTGVCGAAAGGGHQGGHPDALHGDEGGGGGEALREHVPGTARELLQRAGHVCGDEGTGHESHHRRHLPGPAHRDALQQPELRIRGILPAQGHEAAAGQLPGRAGEPDSRHRGEQPHAQGLHRGPGAAQGGVL